MKQRMAIDAGIFEILHVLRELDDLYEPVEDLRAGPGVGAACRRGRGRDWRPPKRGAATARHVTRGELLGLRRGRRRDDVLDDDFAAWRRRR